MLNNLTRRQICSEIQIPQRTRSYSIFETATGCDSNNQIGYFHENKSGQKHRERNKTFNSICSIEVVKECVVESPQRRCVSSPPPFFYNTQKPSEAQNPPPLL